MGASPDEVSARTAAIFLEARALKRLTWPRYNLLDHTVFDRALKTHHADTEIEDLWSGYDGASTFAGRLTGGCATSFSRGERLLLRLSRRHGAPVGHGESVGRGDRAGEVIRLVPHRGFPLLLVEPEQNAGSNQVVPSVAA
jgi:hypothetical protein